MEEVKEKYKVLTMEEFDKVVQKLQGCSLLAFDFETTGLNVIEDIPVGLGIASDTGVNEYLVFRHYGGSETLPDYCLDEKVVMEKLKPFFLDEDILIIAKNFPYDIQFLWKDYNIDIGWKFDIGLAADVQVMSWLDNENRKNHRLDHLCKTILKINMKDLYKDILDGGNIHIYNAELKDLVEYGKLDALTTLELYKYFLSRLEKQKLLDVFWKVEMPYAKVLAKKKRRGIDINLELLELYSYRANRDLEKLRTELIGMIGYEINFNSGQQLGRLLFTDPPDGLGAPVIGYTEGGKKPKKDGSLAPPQPKTDKETLKVLATHDNKPYSELIKKLQRYKVLRHTNSNFIEAIKELIYSDGRVRTNFQHTGTVTGRLSSSGPNLQNQPKDETWLDKYYVNQTYETHDLYSIVLNSEGVNSYTIPESKDELFKVFPYHLVEDKDPDTGEEYKDEDGRYFLVYRKIRDLYYNRDGVLLVADYSQMEMRLMAHFSQDENLMTAFRENKDIHTWGAALVNKIDEEEVTKEMRQNTKAVNFGTIYGKTEYGYAMDWYSQQPDFILGYDSYGNPKINEKYIKMVRQYLNDFFGEFPGVRDYMDYAEAYCKKYGFIKTLTGRRRRLPAIFSEKNWQRAKAKRQAVNTKIQGSAGDYIKMAQVLLERELWGKGVEQAIQIHDEIVFPVSKEVAEKYKDRVKEIMENVVPLSVGIITEPSVVNSWGQVK